jgi:hypothetical protein
MTGRALGAIALAAIILAGCGQGGQIGHKQATGAPMLRISKLQGKVVRLGRLHGAPLYGVRLSASVCARTAAEADQAYPSLFRVAHYVTPRRTVTHWPEAFRVMQNELHWLVPLGETSRGACRDIDFEDVIPPSEYGGLESPLGCLGYCGGYRCYGIQLTLKALGRKNTAMSARRRTIVQCGRFRKPR